METDRYRVEGMLTLPARGLPQPPVRLREPARPRLLHDRGRRAPALDGSGPDWTAPVLMLARSQIRLIVPASTSTRSGAARRLGLVARGGGHRGGAVVAGEPLACPYSQRFWVQAPHPGITRERLREDPRAGPGERDPRGGARHRLLRARRRRLGSAGRPARPGRRPAGDARPHDAPGRRARPREHRSRTSPTRARCRSRTATFDAAYLVTVLGEIPDQDAALAELRRVLRPGGRLVVGELFGDPHMVTHAALVRRASAAGLRSSASWAAGSGTTRSLPSSPAGCVPSGAVRSLMVDVSRDPDLHRRGLRRRGRGLGRAGGARRARLRRLCLRASGALAAEAAPAPAPVVHLPRRARRGV